MKSHRTNTVCIVYDPQIAGLKLPDGKPLGIKSAQAFDWLYSFLHLSTKDNGEVYEGRRWGAFTYRQLADLSNALPNEHAWKRALADLVKAGILFVDHAPGLGNYYTINFHALRKLGEGFNGYELDMARQAADLLHWDDPVEPLPRAFYAEQSAPISPLRLRGGVEQDAPPPQSNLRRLPEHDALTPIYRIDSSLDSSVDSSSTDVDGASADLEAPATVFAAAARVVYPNLVVDEDMRKRLLAYIGQIQNTQIYIKKGERVKPSLDPAIIEDYAIWRMLISDTGRNGFPSEIEFLDEFRYQFFKWYWPPANRHVIERIKSEFPDWRTRLFTGDYVAFRAEVQTRTQPQRLSAPPPAGGSGKSPFARSPEELRRLGFKDTYRVYNPDEDDEP